MSIVEASADSRRRAGVSLTPLIDVVFILLVFFLLAANLQRDETRPLAPAGGQASGETEVRLAYRVTTKGFAPLAGDAGEAPIEASTIAAQWQALPPPEPDSEPVLILQAGEGVGVQTLMDAIARLEAAGVKRIRLIERRDP